MFSHGAGYKFFYMPVKYGYMYTVHEGLLLSTDRAYLANSTFFG